MGACRTSSHTSSAESRCQTATSTPSATHAPNWIEPDGTGWKLDGTGWNRMEADGTGWNRMELDGTESKLDELDGPGWNWMNWMELDGNWMKLDGTG